MDPWDRLLVGDQSKMDCAGPRARTALDAHHVHRFRAEFSDAAARDQWLAQGCSPRYGGAVLEFGRSTSGVPDLDRPITLQAASQGRGAVIWHPHVLAERLQQNLMPGHCPESAARGRGGGLQSVSSPTAYDRRAGHGMRSTAALVIEHRELWSGAGDGSPGLSSPCAAPALPPAEGPYSSRTCAEPSAVQQRAPAVLRSLFPPPLPLHDFSKDRQNALPVTGHLQLLQAPNHAAGSDETAAAMLECTPEERAAVVEERRRSIATRSEGCSWVEVFNAKKGRAIKTESLGPSLSSSAASALDYEGGEDAPSAQAKIVRYMEPFYLLADPKDTTLVFESRFESGNLARAYKIRESEYNLELTPDIRTRGHTQWFYFSIRNVRKGIRYTLNITNFCKRDSLYTNGLRPLMFSERRAKQEGKGWSRCGSKICYFANPKSFASGGGGSLGTTGAFAQEQRACGDDAPHQTDGKKRDESRFTLSFEVEFPHDHDTVYLAHCYPYTYRDLQCHLDSLDSNTQRRKFIRRRVLTKTIANNDLELLTITSGFGNSEQMQTKPVIVISARVHPGETNSSWMMKGILDFLTDPTDDIAVALREMCEFRIVPMLNPDGVINGNYRCNLAGCDLNRHWKQPSPEQHPTIYAHKNMVQQLCKERNVLLTLDLHGHSQKRNVFIYGCHAKYWRSIDGANDSPPPLLHEQIYPYLLSQENESFSFKDCRFRVQKCKAASGRVVCWRECKVMNSYTLEASFCGADQGPGKGMHFNSRDLENMGVSICKTLHRYLNLRLDARGVEAVVADIARLREPWDKQQEAEDVDAADSSSDENVEEPGETFRVRVKLRKTKKKANPPPSQPTSDTDEISVADTIEQTKRVKETSKMIIERLARPKMRIERKERVQPIAVPWVNPSPFDDPTKPRSLGSNRIRQHLDTLSSLAREMKDMGQSDSATLPKSKEFGAGRRERNRRVVDKEKGCAEETGDNRETGGESPMCFARQSPLVSLSSGGEAVATPPLGRRLLRKSSSASVGERHSKEVPAIAFDGDKYDCEAVDSTELTEPSPAACLREGGRAGRGRRVRKSRSLAALEVAAAVSSPGSQLDQTMSAGPMDELFLHHGCADELNDSLQLRRKGSSGASSRRRPHRDARADLGGDSAVNLDSSTGTMQAMGWRDDHGMISVDRAGSGGSAEGIEDDGEREDGAQEPGKYDGCQKGKRSSKKKSGPFSRSTSQGSSTCKVR